MMLHVPKQAALPYLYPLLLLLLLRHLQQQWTPWPMLQ
jgi:hypothetical protein